LPALHKFYTTAHMLTSNTTNTYTDHWNEANIQVFWGEIAPCDHVVQIYENNKVFMDSLEGFVGSGFLAGDSVIIIATEEHLELLEERLKNQGFDLAALIADDLYIPLEVQDSLSKFFIKEWPDEKLFNTFVEGVIERAQKNNRTVRAFGEMVACLWERGYHGATVQLENLWNHLQKKEAFTLFCAYPRIGFTQNATQSIETICCAHTKVIEGGAKPSTAVYYKSVS
jgi:hypothetical protein